ncbi:MAG: type 4a pilus biogenesis protein PilO [Candidatus Omnitrophica bacterium]|nr:type 4a pilus biogenesis protein PilO [Candidatus Omnitrophota bacterium]HOX54203.1 type 4a pilus biogenesis protein PilO [Candidatus Omnitrophota bacterium]
MKNINTDFLKKIDLQKHSKLILGVAAALLFLLDFSLIMKPQLKWLKDLNPKINELRTNIEETRRDIALLKQIEEASQGSKRKMSDIEKRVPQEEDIPLVLQDISKAANDSMIKILQIRPMKEEKEVALKTQSGQYYRIPISIEAKGSYHLFGKFLSTLENSEIFMSVNTLEITSSDKDFKNHNINLVINTFIFKNK